MKVVLLTAIFLLSLLWLSPAVFSVTGGDSGANPQLFVFPKPEMLWGEWHDFSWSPTGDRIAAVANEYLVVMNANGTDVHEIARSEAISFVIGWRSICWSLDGSRITCSDDYHIYTMNADGTNKTRIIDDYAWNPTLSSDGTRIAFSKDWSASELWVMSVDGSNPHVLLSSTDPVFEGHEPAFVCQDWSPDDSKIALLIVDSESELTSLWVVNADGTNATRISPSPGWRRLMFDSVQWSSDGKSILYMSFADEARGTCEINADGTNRTLLIPEGAYGAWSPDGEKIIFYYNPTIFPRASDGNIIFSSSDYEIYLLDMQRPYVFQPDSDADGLPDLWELNHSLSPLNATDAQTDSDNDGLSNLEEYTCTTDLTIADTDDDGLSDGVEIHVFGTDPTKKDTDNDGISDGLEAVAVGFNASVEVLPENWMGMQLSWSNNTIEVLTNSSVIGVTFNATAKELTLSVAGVSGTTGMTNLTIPKAIISSTSNVKIYLDNQPIGFQLNEGVESYFISMDYSHSTHSLVASFSAPTAPKGGQDLLILGISILAVGICSIALFLRQRRPKTET